MTEARDNGAGSDEYVLPRSVTTNHPDGGAPLARGLLDRAYVRIDEVGPRPEAVFCLATHHGDEPIDFEWNFAQLKDRIGAGWDTDVGRLKTENERLCRENIELVGALTAAVSALSDYALALNSAPDTHGKAFEALHRALTHSNHPGAPE